MKNSSLAIVVAIGIIVRVFAVLPYFTNTTVDEALPSTSILQPTMNKDMVDDIETSQTYSGSFVGVGDGIHDANGIAKTIPQNDGSSVLRLEDFRATSGPDLFVYLATDGMASGFVSLGKLKAINGNQNYDIPPETDLEKYNQVLVWCKTFGVLFGSAELSPQ